MARSRVDNPGAGSTGSAQGWGSAIARAVTMVIVVLVAFGLVPNWLLDRLATRVTPTGRDLVIVGWWLVALFACTWLFLRLQGRER